MKKIYQRARLMLFVLVLVCLFLVLEMSYPGKAQDATWLYLPIAHKGGEPKPTSTPISGVQVEILPNHTSYIDEVLGHLNIVGEVANNTSQTVFLAKISVDLFDSSHHLVGTDYTSSILDPLPPNDKTCFRIVIDDTPNNWASYEFEQLHYQTSSSPITGLTILDPSGSINSNGDYNILGMVRNDNSYKMTYVYVVGTLYDSSGRAVGCSSSSLNNTTLNPGESSAFKINYYWRDNNDVVKYRLQVDGSK